MARIDPTVPVTIEPLESRALESLGDRRLFVLLAAGFGTIALLLSAAGVHAMVAFAIARQRREAAIRLALGARPGDVARRVVAQGVMPALGGIVAGVGLALPLGRLIRAQLFQVTPSDPAAIGAAAAAVAAAAIVASIAPARRAARVDPAVALRQE
jgi:ABC-type antimicrobial peptide transport system permease subunit